MICTRCKRPMTSAFLTVSTAKKSFVYGPKCSRILGLFEKKQKRAAMPQTRISAQDDRQMDWLEVVA